MRGAHAVDVIIGGATRFKRGNGSSTKLEPVPVAEQRCRRAVEGAIKRGYRAVKAAHIADHSEKFLRSALSVQSSSPDALQEACAATLTTPERVAGYDLPCIHRAADGGGNKTVVPKDVGLQVRVCVVGLCQGSSTSGAD